MKYLRSARRWSSLSPRSHIRFQSTLDSNKLHQTMTLRDGRTLGYAEYGPQAGLPLMYFHGYPSSRLEGCALKDLPQRHGLRVIVPDRPGFGLSSFQLDRRISDWPADVQSLASHLGLSRFAVMGGSGGGPYALACALYLPASQLSGVGVFAGAPPWSAGSQHMSIYRRVFASMAIYCPRILEAEFNINLAILRRTFMTDWGIRLMSRWADSRKRDEKNGTDVSTEESIRRLVSITREAISQGSAAVVQEMGLLVQDWGFRFEDVAYNKVRIWHGTNDIDAPVCMIRYMADRLPHAVLREFDENHSTMGRHIEGALLEMVLDMLRKKAAA